MIQILQVHGYWYLVLLCLISVKLGAYIKGGGLALVLKQHLVQFLMSLPVIIGVGAKAFGVAVQCLLLKRLIVPRDDIKKLWKLTKLDREMGE